MRERVRIIHSREAEISTDASMRIYHPQYSTLIVQDKQSMLAWLGCANVLPRIKEASQVTPGPRVQVYQLPVRVNQLDISQTCTL